jgi:hypothetical protein
MLNYDDREYEYEADKTKQYLRFFNPEAVQRFIDKRTQLIYQKSLHLRKDVIPYETRQYHRS